MVVSPAHTTELEAMMLRVGGEVTETLTLVLEVQAPFIAVTTYVELSAGEAVTLVPVVPDNPAEGVHEKETGELPRRIKSGLAKPNAAPFVLVAAAMVVKFWLSALYNIVLWKVVGL